MKQAKKLTYDQKRMLSAYGLNPKEWGFVQEWETKIIVRHKLTGKEKAVDKRRKG